MQKRAVLIFWLFPTPRRRIMEKKKFSIPRIIITTILLIIAFVLAYVLYVCIQYSRIEDNLVLDINGETSQPLLATGKTYSAATYNIGFGAYGPEFSFFMCFATHLFHHPQTAFRNSALFVYKWEAKHVLLLYAGAMVPSDSLLREFIGGSEYGVI